jgi:DNA-directed RNA polymerase subunit K/omega
MVMAADRTSVKGKAAVLRLARALEIAHNALTYLADDDDGAGRLARRALAEIERALQGGDA